MQIYIKLFGSLRDKLPKESNGETILAVPPNATIQVILDQLGIQQPVEVGVNEVHEVNKSHVIQDGDRVFVFLIVGGG